MEAEIERLRRELAERPVVRQHTDVHHYHYHITTSSPSSPDDNDDDNNNNMPPAASGPRPNPEHSRRARIGCIYVGVGSLHHQDAPRCKAHRYGSSVYGGFAPADMAPRGPASLRPVLPGNVGGPWRLTRESQFHIKKFESDDAVIPAKAMLMPFDDDNDAAEEINADVELERESSERLSPEQEPCGKTTVAVEGGC
ncbi:hypothetical protein SLS58_007104 [Diplodia intermedia]|uniref:Uncharacterized protein n=1 Tax=Diplodia intermedia TaxID=856260 RepID=A0ABR3TLM2_9PEZI